MSKFKLPRPGTCKQIRLKCLDCSGESNNEVKFCSVPDCPLWLLRFGKYPSAYVALMGKGSEILFDRKQFFEEGGIFYGAHQSVEEAERVYKNHLSRKNGDDEVSDSSDG